MGLYDDDPQIAFVDKPEHKVSEKWRQVKVVKPINLVDQIQELYMNYVSKLNTEDCPGDKALFNDNQVLEIIFKLKDGRKVIVKSLEYEIQKSS